MNMSALLRMVPLLLTFLLHSQDVCIAAPSQCSEENIWKNDIPPRFQWDNNSGYCGEVSFISAGLYYGQYMSQYDARAATGKNAKQNNTQLLIGQNDIYAATQMHLKAVEYNTDGETDTDQFLAWVKQYVLQGYPVAIGIYTNEYLFYTDTNPNAGDPVYDHIVPVIGIGSNHPLSDYGYYGDDIIYLSDNGLWGNSKNPPYNFSYSFNDFQANRQQANAENRQIYSLDDNAQNYGVAITGVMDLNGDTLPVLVSTNVNYEKPQIINGSNTRPPAMPLELTITVSGLEPGVEYNLYRYNVLSKVPDSDFNASAANAFQSWRIEISSGSDSVVNQQIQSDEIAVYRAVRASAS